MMCRIKESSNRVKLTCNPGLSNRGKIFALKECKNGLIKLKMESRSQRKYNCSIKL